MAIRIQCCAVDINQKRCCSLSQKNRQFCRKHAQLEREFEKYHKMVLTGNIPRENECDMCGGYSNPIHAPDGKIVGYRCTQCCIVWQTDEQYARYPFSFTEEGQ